MHNALRITSGVKFEAMAPSDQAGCESCTCTSLGRQVRSSHYCLCETNGVALDHSDTALLSDVVLYRMFDTFNLINSLLLISGPFCCVIRRT